MDNISDTTWSFKGEVDYVDEWMLMRTPIPLIIISLSYLLFVLKLGPELMKNRPAFKTENLLIVYNALQVAYSCYLVQLGLQIIWSNGILGKSCMTDTPGNLFIITTSTYAYFSAKVSELADTVFFVLRKKYSQVTFLHVYHHLSIMWCTWIILKYEPSYSVLFLGTLNSFVHIIMYAYYGLSAFPSLTKYLWWKRYITRMQLVQFFIIILQAYLSTKMSGCPPTTTVTVLIYFNGLLFIYLFGRFYIKTYTKSTVTGTRSFIEKSVKFN